MVTVDLKHTVPGAKDHEEADGEVPGSHQHAALLGLRSVYE